MFNNFSWDYIVILHTFLDKKEVPILNMKESSVGGIEHPDEMTHDYDPSLPGFEDILDKNPKHVYFMDESDAMISKSRESLEAFSDFLSMNALPFPY